MPNTASEVDKLSQTLWDEQREQHALVPILDTRG
jgi:hypothetical protein